MAMRHLSFPVAITGPATTVLAEGARVGITSCLICGAALLLDPREQVDVVALHRLWHGQRGELPSSADSMVAE